MKNKNESIKTAVIFILTDETIMDGNRFELRIDFGFEANELKSAKLYKRVGQPRSSQVADLDPIDFKIALGCLSQEDRHILGRPGFRTYEYCDDPERRFLIDVQKAKELIADQARSFIEQRKRKPVRVNKPVSAPTSRELSKDSLSAIDSALADAETFRATVTSRDQPTR